MQFAYCRKERNSILNFIQLGTKLTVSPRKKHKIISPCRKILSSFEYCVDVAPCCGSKTASQHALKGRHKSLAYNLVLISAPNI
jgi:hypothetical protein